MKHCKVPSNPPLMIRREEYPQVNLLANHINKEQYLHDKLMEEKLLRKSIVIAMNKENHEIKEKTKHVIEIFKEKLSKAELCIKQYNKKMKLLEMKLYEKHVLLQKNKESELVTSTNKKHPSKNIEIAENNHIDIKFSSPEVISHQKSGDHSNPSTACKDSWCTPQSLSSGNLTPEHTPHHTTAKKSTAKKNLYFNSDIQITEFQLDMPSINTPPINEIKEEISSLSEAKHRIVELTKLVKELKSNQIQAHHQPTTNTTTSINTDSKTKKIAKLQVQMSSDSKQQELSVITRKLNISPKVEEGIDDSRMTDELDITSRIKELESYNLDSNIIFSPIQNNIETHQHDLLTLLPKSTSNNTSPMNNPSETTPLVLNITQEMESDIAEIVTGMEVNVYKTQIEELTIQIETLKEESTSRSFQSMNRIKELQYEISIQNKLLEEAEVKITCLQHNINDLKHQNTKKYEEYLLLSQQSESEKQAMQSMIQKQEEEIEKLSEQINVERRHFLKLKKSLIKLDGLKSSIQSIQSTPMKTESSLPINQITEVYHLGIEQGTKLFMQSQEKQSREQYQEFQNIQKKLREKLAILQLETIQLKQSQTIDQIASCSVMEEQKYIDDQQNNEGIKPADVMNRLNELQHELEKQITECVFNNQKLLDLQGSYSSSELFQQLTLKAKECKEYQLKIEELERKIQEKLTIEFIHNNNNLNHSNVSISNKATKQYQTRIQELEKQVNEMNESMDMMNNNRSLDQAIRTIKELEKNNQQLLSEKETLQNEINQSIYTNSNHINDINNNSSSMNSNSLLEERLIQLKQAFYGMFHSNDENNIHCHCDFICKLLHISDSEEHSLKEKISILIPYIVYSNNNISNSTLLSKNNHLLWNDTYNGIANELKSALPTLFNINKSYTTNTMNNKKKE